MLYTPKACQNIESAKTIYREKLDEEEQSLYLKMDDEQIQEMKEFFDNFKNLIQDTYTLNGNKKVVLIGHSMGNTNVLYFLNQQPQKWKDQYVAKFVSLAGPYGGAAKTLRLVASGTK